MGKRTESAWLRRQLRATRRAVKGLERWLQQAMKRKENRNAP
jgi:hypothetical protein